MLIFYFLNSQKNATFHFELGFNVSQGNPSMWTLNLETDVTNILGVAYKKSIPLTSSVLFTDYTNIMIRYSCQEVENYWYKDINDDFFILVRNRTFDQWRPVSMALTMLANITDINHFRPQVNGPNACPN